MFDYRWNLSDMYRGSIPWFLKNKKSKKIIYISSSNKNLENYYDFLLDNSEKEVKIFENTSRNKEDLIGININLVECLKDKKEYVILVNLQIALSSFFDNFNKFSLQKNKEYKLRDIQEFFENNNYSYNYLVEKKGEWSKRGDIIDVFPPNRENPIRLEFFDTELESIREFDINNQKSIHKINEIEVFSNNFIEERNIDLINLIDEIKKEEVEVYIENDDLVNYKIEEYILSERDNELVIRSKYKKIEEKGEKINLKVFSSTELDIFKTHNKIEDFSKKNKVELYVSDINKYEKEYKETNVKLKSGELIEGFVFDKAYYLSEREIEGIIKSKRQIKKIGVKYKNYSQIREEDYVIHEEYGVGIYKGLTEINNRDYLKIKYADEDILYVPIEHLDRLEKYVSEGDSPKIYNLGTKGFKRKRKKLEEDIIEFAKELIEIQARRSKVKGFSYLRDTVWQEEFEEKFPFDETPDQKKVILDVKNDMESSRVMDRVVCGDVGYGKTEVAMRAAFKAINSSKQVAVVAPTTVLVKQHYDRFLKRFEDFPVTIRELSRISSAKEIEKTLKEIENGYVDLVIGTHRVLSSDVRFKDLGLLIIDEEQKFGVKAKELLKKKKSELDILTLTATPIPRTLNLALLGIRDISIIETPPANRLPIITEVIDGEDEEIKETILKEVARDGQVFFISNKVKQMEYKVKEIEDLLPDFIRVDFINGQLPTQVIKQRLQDFESGKIDVLVSSVIIENGVDISNANTILIEDFTNLGLAQTYQLRGRVGRGERQGYCYLIKGNSKTKKSKKKEEFLRSVEGVSSGGFQLSMEDLKVRGAGEILGKKQHGAVETFGYNLYLKMLNEEISKIKGHTEENKSAEVTIQIENKGTIPSYYINDNEKIEIYKRFVLVDKLEELHKLSEEIKDRFGKFPVEVIDFIKYIELKIKAKQNKIESISQDKNKYLVIFNEEVNEEMLNILEKNGNNFVVNNKEIITKDIYEMLDVMKKK